MPRDTLLVALTVAGSALCWWPVIIQPNLDLPFLWLPLALVAITTGLATALSGKSWLRFVAASIAGTFAGMLAGFLILPLTDGIEAAYSPIAVAVGTAAAVPVSLVGGGAMRNVSLSNERLRRAAWVVFLGCVAFGPVALALTPPVVAYRVARNDRIAAERFEALKDAVAQAMAEAGGRAHTCLGRAFKRQYSGPPFSESDWWYISGNYVKQDGYVFMVNCYSEVGYTIDAFPARAKGDGTRHFYFCTDGTGRVDCHR
jgi:hypothetical protein